tara:strand:+ start:2563 stop:3954 length:1392 start_codon:yes stop_codon:yes gene_type:complete
MGNVMAVASAHLSTGGQNGYTEYLVDSTKDPSDRNIFENWLQDVFDKAHNYHYRKRACCTGQLHKDGLLWRRHIEHTHGIEIPIANLWKSGAETTSYPDIGDMINSSSADTKSTHTAISDEIRSINSGTRDNDRIVLGKGGFILRRLPFDHHGSNPEELKEKCEISNGVSSANYQRMMNPLTAVRNPNGYQGAESTDSTNRACKDLYANVCRPAAQLCTKNTGDQVSINTEHECSASMFPTHKQLNISYRNDGLDSERVAALNYPLDCGCTNSVTGEYWNEDADVFNVDAAKQKPATFDKSCRNQIRSMDGGVGYTYDRTNLNDTLCINNLNINDNAVAGSILVSNITQTISCGGEPIPSWAQNLDLSGSGSNSGDASGSGAGSGAGSGDASGSGAGAGDASGSGAGAGAGAGAGSGSLPAPTIPTTKKPLPDNDSDNKMIIMVAVMVNVLIVVLLTQKGNNK